MKLKKVPEVEYCTCNGCVLWDEKRHKCKVVVNPEKWDGQLLRDCFPEQIIYVEDKD